MAASPGAEWAQPPAGAKNVCRETDPHCVELEISGDALIDLIQGLGPITIL